MLWFVCKPGAHTTTNFRMTCIIILASNNVSFHEWTFSLISYGSPDVVIIDFVFRSFCYVTIRFRTQQARYFIPLSSRFLGRRWDMDITLHNREVGSQTLAQCRTSTERFHGGVLFCLRLTHQIPDFTDRIADYLYYNIALIILWFYHCSYHSPCHCSCSYHHRCTLIEFFVISRFHRHLNHSSWRWVEFLSSYSNSVSSATSTLHPIRNIQSMSYNISRSSKRNSILQRIMTSWILQMCTIWYPISSIPSFLHLNGFQWFMVRMVVCVRGLKVHLTESETKRHHIVVVRNLWKLATQNVGI